jgi:DNA-binding transcriptional regulator YiaG
MSRDWTPESIKELRKRLGKTQKEFGEMLGVHVVTIIRWEQGSFNPSKMALKLLDSYAKQ